MLSEARHKQLMSSLNSTARKVYEVVPIQEAWTVKQIGIVLHRAGTPQGQDVLLACLDNLRRTGLVTERAGCFQRIGVRRKKAHNLADLQDVLQTGIEQIKEAVHDAFHPPAGRIIEEAGTPATPYTPPPETLTPVTPAITKPTLKVPMTATTTHPEDVVETLSGLSQSMNALALAQQRELTELISRHRAEMEALAHAVADAAVEVQGALEGISEEVKTARELKALMKRIGG